MLSRGFFTIAQGEKYQKLAYALALSLKLSQKKYSNLTVGVTKAELKTLPQKYIEIFDNVVEIPWNDHAEKSEWKLENEWKAIHMTPYDETIKLDADMFFPQDITSWWSSLEKSNGVFTTSVMTYSGQPATSNFYRKTFTESRLPNVYTAFFYFKKNDINFELFKHAEFIFNNWERCFYEFLQPEHRPTFVSTDVVFAIAAKIMDYEQYNAFPGSHFPTFVHMKTLMQGWPDTGALDENWTKYITKSFNNDCQLKLGNYMQLLPLHYHIKEFMTDKMIAQMERKLGI